MPISVMSTIGGMNLNETASDERFRWLVEGIENYAIYMLDVNGHIASWNSGAKRIKGYDAQEIIGKHFSCFYLPEDIAAGTPMKSLESSAAVGHFEDEGRRVRKDGGIFWAHVLITPIKDDAGTLRGFSKVTHDISDRRRTDEKTRLMVELAMNAMILVDRWGVIVRANPQVEKLFGYTQHELLGQPVELLVPETFRSLHPLQRTKFFANPSIRAMGAGRDLHGQHKNGTEIPVEIGLNPMQVGDEFLVLCSIIDITERKRFEETERRHVAQLAHAGRLSTVGEMFSGLAHEINQPLAAAANFARAGIRFAKSDPEIGKDQLLEWLEKSASEVERASDIVRRLGAFTKRGGSTGSKIDVNQLIENIVGVSILLTATAEGRESTSVRLDLAESLPRIFADKLQIEQVLVNLIRNSVEAMDALPVPRRELFLKSERLENVIQVSVTDNGHGMNQEQLTQLFSPFFTTKATGMGLGLSISKSIVEAHGGKMLVSSAPDQGTTISFQLPLESGEASA